MNAVKAEVEKTTLTPDEEAFIAYQDAWRQELAKNWTDGHYTQMPNAVRQDRTLSQKAKVIYEQLLSYMWFKTDRCWPSQVTIAEATGYSRRSVIRALNELYERGYIEKWRRGLGETNYYFINPLSFVRSFHPLPDPARRGSPARTADHLPFNNMISIDAPELRQDISQATPRPAVPVPLFIVDPEVPNCHNGSAKDAHEEMPDWHTKQTNTKSLDSIEEGEIPNGVAILPGGEGGDSDPKTIGNPTERVPETEGTEESPPKHAHQTQQTEERTREEERPPADLQNDQKNIIEYKTPRIAIESLVREFTPILNDHQAMKDEKFMQSNVTRAVNLFERHGVWTQEDIQVVMHQARGIALAIPEEEVHKINPDDGSKNRIGLFYHWLANRIEHYSPGVPPAAQEKSSRKKKNSTTPKATSSVPNGSPFTATSSRSGSGMSRSEAEILARDIRKQAEALGISPVTVQQEGSVATVTFTWRGNTVTIKTREKWESLQPKFARQVEQAKQQEGERHGSL